MTEEWTGQIEFDHTLTPDEIDALAGKAQIVWRAPDGHVAYWPLNDPPLIRKRVDGGIRGGGGGCSHET